MLGFAMLSITCVPGTPLVRLTPLCDASPAEAAGDELESRDVGPIAAENAPRSETTLLTASGDTRAAAFGGPSPLAVEASSGGSEMGGGTGGGP
jgi:hypothetical protein